MPLTIACPGCGQRFAVSDKMRGKKAKCSKCSTVLTIPAPEPVAAEIVADELELAPISSAADPLGLGSLPDPLARSATATYHASAAPNQTRLILLAVGGGGVLVVLILIAIAVSQIRSLIANRPPGSAASSSSAQATVGLDPSAIAVPGFPELGAAQTLPGGVKVYFVDTRTSPTNRGSEPGMSMRMRVYIPSGEHAARSLPCVLIAPAGTPLITGNDVDAGDYHDETLPYAQAGMVAIMYSLDGPAPETQLVAPIAAAYKQFKAAKGGVVNGRNALEFALQKLPQVDPQRIYTAGHSSAATVSLLVAAHEPRVKACLAYAPCCDVELRLKDLANDWQASRAMPGLAGFLRDTSPTTHLGKYKCPVFVFHARDDSNEPFGTTERFVTAMRQASANITFATSDHGDHYESMIDFGIPQGIAWLKQLP